MPLGAARISFLAKSQVTVVAEVIRKKVGVSALGNAQVDTTQSQFGGASASFDGTGDYLTMSDSSFDFGTNDFTIECWVRSTSATNQGVWQLSTSSSYLQSNFNNLAVAFRGDTSNWTYYSNGLQSGLGSSSTNTWYHVALVRSSGTINFYVDGTSVNSESDTTDYSGVYLAIGGYYSTNFLLTGNIDEFRISNTARYTANFTPSTTPFVNDDNTLLLLHMDGSDGSITFDDDNGERSQAGVSVVGTAQVDTSQSQFGGASANLGGTGQLRAYNDNLNLNSDFTLEGWFYFTSTTGDNGLFSKFIGSPSQGYNIRYASSVGGIRSVVVASGGSTFAQNYSWSPSTNTWYHVACVRSSNTYTVYIDGSSIGSNTLSFDPAPIDDPVNIGEAATVPDSEFRGFIDEVRISATARYTTGFTPDTTPFTNDATTLLLLHMDGTDGSTDFIDDNGSVRTRVGVSAVGNAQISTAQSQFGSSSASFDGTGDYLEIEDAVVTTQPFTIEFWYRDNATGNYRAIFEHGPGTTTTGYFRLGTDTSNHFHLRTYKPGGTTDLNLFSTTTISTGTWYHVAITKDGNDWKLYIDGSLEDSGTATVSITSSGPFKIGQVEFFSDANAYIDEFRISDSVRYTTGFTVPTEPFQNDDNTLLLLHCDGSDGQTTFLDDNGVY